MRIAVLPFNAAPGADEAMGRQLAVFLSELMRTVMAPDSELAAVNYMGRTEQEDGSVLFHPANPSDAFNDEEMIQTMVKDAEVQGAIDGLLEKTDTGGRLTLRHFDGEGKKTDEAAADWQSGQMLPALFPLFRAWMTKGGGEVTEEMSGHAAMFRANSDEIFENYMRCYDALQFIERSEGNVAREWSPEAAYRAGVAAFQSQPDWENIFFCVMELTRVCFRYQIGTAELGLTALKSCLDAAPNNAALLFNIGSFLCDIGDVSQGVDLLDRASQQASDQPNVWIRLGIAQIQAGMPVNAERSLRKGVELQGDDVSDLTGRDALASVLFQSNRGHEGTAVWKDMVAKAPENAAGHARLAQSLIMEGKNTQAEKQMEESIEQLGENAAEVKRVYAVVLKQKNELDAAMDMYEDYLDVNPVDVQAMLEYAETLVAADRSFEAVKVLQDVMKVNIDPNTKAQTQAWLIELEQPKRVEAFLSAAERAEQGDAEGALKELKPLRNWLADYWKMWLLLASLHNRMGEHMPAEEAARRLMDLFPGNEGAYVEMANALTGQERHDEAYQLAAYGMQAVPNSLGIALTFGLTAKRAGRPEEARTMARQIREALGANHEFEPILAEMEA